MSRPLYHTCNTRPQVALDISLRKTNSGQQDLSFLGSNIWTKISYGSKAVKTTASFTHALKRKILSKLWM